MNWKDYKLMFIFMALAVISAGISVIHELGWKKAYCLQHDPFGLMLDMCKE